KTTYSGGSGGDSLTYNASAVSKAVSLGAGIDSIDISHSTSLTASIDGGADSDRLTISSDLLSRVTTGSGRNLISNFESLVVTGDLSGQTIDLSRVGTIRSLDLTEGGSVNLTQVADSTDIELFKAGGAYHISNSAFTKGSNDSISISLSNRGNEVINYAPRGVTLQDVETAFIFAPFPNSSDANGSNFNILDVRGNTLERIFVLGYSGLELRSDSTTLTKVDFDNPRSTGATFTAPALTREASIIGVDKSNVVNTFDLSAAKAVITYTGGAGSDVIKVNGLLNQVNVGSSGLDHVTISAAGANSIAYTTISNAHAGLTLSLPGAISSFAADKIAPGNATVALTLANAFVQQSGNASTQAATGWFQLDGNTWIVQSRHDASGSNSGFLNGTDVLVKLTGLIDLSHAQVTANYDLLLA
ncbi:MAG: hypothetical protein RL748_3289, partial [Pseudomonadota bacterium]